jgi:hypothetical protein
VGQVAGWVRAPPSRAAPALVLCDDHHAQRGCACAGAWAVPLLTPTPPSPLTLLLPPLSRAAPAGRICCPVSFARPRWRHPRRFPARSGMPRPAQPRWTPPAVDCRCGRAGGRACVRARVRAYLRARVPACACVRAPACGLHGRAWVRPKDGRVCASSDLGSLPSRSAVFGGAKMGSSPPPPPPRRCPRFAGVPVALRPLACLSAPSWVWVVGPDVACGVRCLPYSFAAATMRQVVQADLEVALAASARSSGDR